MLGEQDWPEEGNLQSIWQPRFDAGSHEATNILPANSALALFAPRGIGDGKWGGDEKKQVQIRRRFYLLGQSLDGMRVWDVRRAIQALRSLDELAGAQVEMRGEGVAAAWALYASLFEDQVRRLTLHRLPGSHRDGPFLLNVRRYLDLEPRCGPGCQSGCR